MPLDPNARIPLESLPVFPLPNAVLFPEQQMPLHIFEPRYRQLVRDALETEPYLVIARIEGDPGLEPPRFSRVCTAGKIVAHQRLADGRFNIVVEGAVRVATQEIPSTSLYRRVQCTALSEPHGHDDAVAASERVALLSLAGMVLQIARARSKGLEFTPPAEQSPGRLAFRIADRLVSDGTWRQRILEAQDTPERVARTTEALAHVLSEIGGATGGRGRGSTIAS